MASAGGDEGETLALNIMPLLDIFSILILFLLMSFSTDPLNHDITEGIELPDSDTMLSLDELPKIVVTPSQLLFNNKPIAALLNGDIQQKDNAQGGIQPLFDELVRMAEFNKQKKLKSDNLTMELHKEHQFKLMKRIMFTASQAEFIKFKLMVAKTQS